MGSAPVLLKLEATLEGFAVDGETVAPVPDTNARGGVPIVHRVTVLNAASGDIDLFVEHKIAITDVWLVKQGAAGGVGDTIQVTDGDNAPITEAMSINVADKTIVRATQLDDATAVIPANGTLRVKRVKAGAANVRCAVIVQGVRI